MRALVIDMRDGGDWSMDLLFAGLVQNLGAASVDMFPWKEKHVSWDGNGDWGKERRSFGHTITNKFLFKMSEFETKRMAFTDSYDYIFLDERMESYEQYLRLGLNLINCKVVVVAGHDQFQNQSPEFVKNLYGRNFHMMFLDNWRDEWSNFPWARLMNLSCNWDHFWDVTKREELLKNKVFDLCFMGYNSHPNRNFIMTHLEKRWGHLNNHIVFERKPGTTEAFVSHKDFFEVIAQSKICINLPGAAFGGRAMRFYQIPYVGSFMLSQKFKGKQLEEFEHDVHCKYFDNLDELDSTIIWALDNEKKREILAQAGHWHAMTNHSSKARVKYLLDEVENG